MTASTNVMSVGPQPSGGSKAVSAGSRQPARTGGRAHTDSQGNGKFGKVLDQTQDSGKISAQDVSAAPDEAMDIPKDPIAAAIAASSQQNQTNQPEGGAAAETDVSVKAAAGSRQVSESLVQAASGLMQDPETAAAELLGNTGNNKDVSAGNSGLQTLIPQSEEEGTKGKSMLNMLSGQNWRQASVQSVNQEMTKEAGLMNGRMVETIQDVQSAENPQVSQQDGQSQQQMQQGRSQAQPGMQGMPMMQDAQAPLTRPAQTEAEPQTAVMSEGQGPAAKMSGISQEQQMPGEMMRQGSGTGTQELQERKNVGTPGEVKLQAAQPDVLQQDSVQQQKNGEPANNLSRPLIRHDDASEMSQSQKQLPAEPKAAEAFLKGTETTQPAAAAETLKKTRQDLSELLGTQVASETADEQLEVNPIRQAMHGQQQSEEGRQQTPDRQPAQGMTQGIIQGAEETAEDRGPVQNINQQNNVETPAQSHQAGNFQQVMNTTQSQAADNTQAPMTARQDFNVPQQIVEQARLIRSSENTEMVIHLKPEHLGDLTLKVSVSGNGSVTASFHSDNAQVRAIIENSLVQLRQELSNQGIKVDNVEVYAGLSGDSLMNGQGQQAWQQNQQGSSSRNRSFDFDSYEEEEIEVSAASGEMGAEEGVDYRV